MDKIKINLGSAALEAGKSTSEFLNKAKKAVVDAVDQNGDGEISLDDVSAFSTSVKSAIKESNEKRADKQSQARREKELKALHPLFEADVETPEFSLPKLIRVAEMDNKHSESEVCRNSIGFVFPGKELDVITLYPNKIADFDLKFYPDMDSEVYYVDPADRDHYIALDNYYNYLKVARIGELQRIAQELGAKRFRVIYKELQKTGSTAGVKGKANAKAAKKQGASLSVEHHRMDNSNSKIEIAAEMECIGHKPVLPTLKYFRRDPQILSLVSLRMADNAMTHQVYTLELCNSSGIKEKDATKIDAALSAMKIGGNISITNEVHREMRRIFEYEIDF